MFLNRTPLHSCDFPWNSRFINKSVFVLIVSISFLMITLFQDETYAATEPISKESMNEKAESSEDQGFSIMQQQLRDYKEKLRESERALEEFQQYHGVISLESQINFLLQQRNGLDNSLKEAANKIKGFQEKLAWVQSRISEVPQVVPLSKTSHEQGVIGGAKNQLLGLQLREQQLLTKYTEESPHVEAVREEMDVISTFIKNQEAKEAESVSTGKNPLYAKMEMELFETQADLISAEAQRAVIRKQIAEVDKELERLRSLRPGEDELRRQVKADEANYLNYLTKVGTTPPQDYRVQVGDELDIKFFFNPELNESIPVRPDGRIALQLVGEISVVGHTVEEIREILIKNYSGQLKNPEIAVLLRTSHVLAGSSSGTQGSTMNSNVGVSNGN